MALPSNALQNVATFQRAELAWMLNESPAISMANKKFLHFQEKTANLGDTITFDLAPRATSTYGLIVNPQAAIQRVQNLVCSQAINSTIAFSEQQLLFNVSDYMERFGKARIMQVGSKIEQDLLKNITGTVTVNDPQNTHFGEPTGSTGPFRFYGNGVDSISSYQQLAQAAANFEDFGAANYDRKAIIPTIAEPAIIANGLTQFALNRNNKDAESWEVGDFAGFRWAKSNLLPVHFAGTVGQTTSGGGNILTLVSVNDPTGKNITQLTFSGATANDVNAIKKGDMFEFQDGVAGQPNLRFLTFTGGGISAQKVQNVVSANAAADGSGNVTITVGWPLVSAPTVNLNLNATLAPGMKIKVMNSHRAGVIMSGNPLYLAMPRLGDTDPFKSYSTTDSETGASIRHYWGTVLGQNEKIYAWDQIWGSTLIPENSMRLLFPLNQT